MRNEVRVRRQGSPSLPWSGELPLVAAGLGVLRDGSFKYCWVGTPVRRVAKDRMEASLPGTCLGPLRVGGVQTLSKPQDLRLYRAKRISAPEGQRPRKGHLAENTQYVEVWNQLGELGLGPFEVKRASKAGPPIPAGKIQGCNMARPLELCDSEWVTVLW